MNAESNNDIWGLSKNPWNSRKISGGSSGGEGAVVAARCSVLGIGSDSGGSIRIPSAFCGCYGFKPSTKRIPKGGELKSLTVWAG